MKSVNKESFLQRFLFIFMGALFSLTGVFSVVNESYADKKGSGRFTISHGDPYGYGKNFTNLFTVSSSINSDNGNVGGVGVCVEPGQWTPGHNVHGTWGIIGSTSDYGRCFTAGLVAKGYVSGAPSELVNKFKAEFAKLSSNSVISWHVACAKASKSQTWSYGAPGYMVRNAGTVISNIKKIWTEWEKKKEGYFKWSIFRVNPSGQDLYVGRGEYHKKETPGGGDEDEHKPKPGEECDERTIRGGGGTSQSYIHEEGVGNLKVLKSSSNESITKGNPAYDLTTVTFSLSGPSGTQTRTVTNGESVEFTGLSEGSYTLTEVHPGTNYKTAQSVNVQISVNKDSGTRTYYDEEWEETEYTCYKTIDGKRTGEITSSYTSGRRTTRDAYSTESWNKGGSSAYTPDTNQTISVSNEPKLGNFTLKKACADKAIINSNNNYTLRGAEYVLKHKYLSGVEYKLVTGEDGTATVRNIPRGEYTLTEIKNPMGYALDKKAQNVSVMNDENTHTHTEKPFYDPVGLILKKVDDKQFRLGDKYKPQGDMKLDGAVFTFKFYDDDKLTDETVKSATPIFSFDFKTRVDSSGQIVGKLTRQTISNWQHKGGITLDQMIRSQGGVNELKLPIGTFNISEKTAPEGYDTRKVLFKNGSSISNGNSYTRNIRLDRIGNNAELEVLNQVDENTIVHEYTHISGKVKVAKFDDRTHNKTSQGDAKLKATFNIINRSPNNIFVGEEKFAPGDVVETITTDDNSREVECKKSLPYGTYELVEKSTDKTYNLVPYTKTFKVREDGKVYDFTGKEGKAAENSVKRGGLVLRKYSRELLRGEPEGDASLAGAEFTIINRSAEAVYHPNKEEIYKPGDVVAVIKTDEKGYAKTLTNMLPIGIYEVYESKPSEGYLINSSWKKIFKITEDKQIVNLDQMPNLGSSIDPSQNNFNDKKAIPETIIRGGLTMIKSDKDRINTNSDGNNPQGDTSLAGAQFTITNRSKHLVKVEGKEYPVGAIVKTITTNEKGIAETSNDTLPYGTYEIKESKAPAGYFVDKNWSATVHIRKDGEIVKANAVKNNPVKEQIFRGDVKILKIDVERAENKPQGNATLKGAEYDIYNDSLTDVYVGGKWYAKGAVVTTIVTGEDGIAKTEGNLLPYGTYHIVEKIPSKGYLLNSNYRADFKIREDGKLVDLTKSDKAPEQVIRGDVQVTKYDSEFDKSEALGGKDHKISEHGTTLSGMRFAIKNISKEAVYVDGTLYKTGQVVKTITSHWNDEKKAYTAETVNRTLPYGKYEIQEVGTNKTYNLSDQAVRTFEITKDGETVITDVQNNNLVFKNRVIRADMDFTKIAENKDPMSTLWSLENLTTGETHILTANKEGKFTTNSKDIPHSKNTNVNDKYLELAKTGQEISMKDIELDTGIWFGKGEDGSMALVNDKLGALPYGAYRLKELKTDTNHYHDKKEFIFYVYKDNDPVKLGNITNIKHEISTSAINDETGIKVGSAKKASLIRDKVSYRNFIIGNKYKLVATLMDKETNSPIVNGKGEIVTGTRVFRASSTKGDVDVLLNCNGLDIAGKTVVVFEEAFDADGQKVAEHSEIADEKQTVYYPIIGTTATGVDTKDHDAPSTKTIKIVDRVHYENLVVGNEYTMSGVLMNQKTNKPVLYKSGREVRMTKKFTPDKTSGDIDLEFEVDGDILQGETVVAFETLKYKNIPIAVHTEINDENQSVHFPKIRTTATSELTKDHDGGVIEKTIIHDKVRYNNLLVGKEYILKATLMNKKTNKAVVDADGKTVVSEKKFIPATTDGEVVVDFVFNAKNLAGTETVAFERLERVGVELATHTEINDEGQTVRFPKIGTTALYDKTNLHEGLADKMVTIVDNVKFFNLIPGKEYVMSGVLMDKDSKSPVKDGDKIVSNSIKFTPTTQSGSIDIPFTFHARVLEGHTVVAFESLSRKGKELTVHADINDKAQTVNFPKIRTSLVDKETNMKMIDSNANITLIDTVKYENLTPGVKYTMTGKLMVKSTKKALSRVEPVSVNFVPKTRDGVVRVEFKLNTKDLDGESLVAFEKCSRYEGDVTVAIHEDINDEGQTVKVPKIGTQARSNDTGNQEGITKENNVVKDIVAYENLIPNMVYRMEGTLIDKQTRKPLLQKDGSKVTAMIEFTPKKESGQVELTFTFDSDKLAGRDIVAFEKLSQNGVVIGRHENPDDEGQTVHYPKIGTSAAFITGIKEGMAEKKVTIVDTVEYKNLRIGQKYEVVGTLVNPDTNKVLVDNTGKAITAKAELVPKTADGKIDVKFEFDGSKLAGQRFVIFEDLIRNSKILTYHRDIKDRKQTVYFPKIGTRLIDKASNTHQSVASKDTVLVDSVKYHNLIVGNSYTMSGILMDKETNKPMLIDGKEIKAQTNFIAKTRDGVVDVVFKFDGTKLQGRTVVAFENLSREGHVVAVHADITDKEQSVNFPKIRTSLVDNTTKTHQMAEVKKSVVVDTVSYSGLIPGENYTMTGTLMDKETGKALLGADGKPVTASREFTAENYSGKVDITFEIEGVDLRGKTLVAFEKLFSDKREVAVHEDINDKAQTIYMMKVSTKATGLDKRSKDIDMIKKAKVVDAISYVNLSVKDEYKVETTLKDVKTGKVVKRSDGKDAVAISKFTPKDPKGVVETTVEFDATKLQGQTLVVAQKIFDKNGVQVGSHDDINDKDQQVTVKTVTVVNTGLHKFATFLAVVTGILSLVGVALYQTRKRFE